MYGDNAGKEINGWTALYETDVDYRINSQLKFLEVMRAQGMTQQQGQQQLDAWNQLNWQMDNGVR